MDKKPNNASVFGRLMQEAGRDKKKTGILVALTVTAAIVILRAVLQTSCPVPASAAMLTDSTSAKTAAAGIRRTPAGVADPGDERKEAYLAALDHRITRDLFSLNDSVYPPQVVAKVETTSQPVATQPVVSDAADAERKAILARAETLKLQSVIVGANSTATINDKVLRVGGQIQGFEVESISEDSCVVRKKDVRVTLAMKQDN